jgi:hypothetical protein
LKSSLTRERKFLLKLFSKSLQGGGAEPPIAALFFFDNFFLLRLQCQKKKVAAKFSQTNRLLVNIHSIAGFSLQIGGAKKTLSKRNTEDLFRLVREATRAPRP